MFTPSPFCRAAAHYDAHAFVQREMAKDLLQKLPMLRLSPSFIVDLGAGTGLLSEKLIKMYPNSLLLALDASEAMIKLASNRLKSQTLFSAAQAESLCLKPNSVDLLVSNAMLQWCADARIVMRECQRVLTPGGAFLFSTFGPNTLQELRASWSQSRQQPIRERFADMHLLGDALIEAGFQDPVMDTRTLIVEYPSAIMLLHDLKNIGANHWRDEKQTGLIGRAQFQRFIEYYNQYRNAAGKIPATYEIVYGLAWKASPS